MTCVVIETAHEEKLSSYAPLLIARSNHDGANLFLSIMQYSLYINQLFIANHPQCDDLDFTDVAIFDCVRKLIAGNWGNKKLIDGVLWANISVKKILDEMPMLRTSRAKPMTRLTVHRRITKLCEAGLLQRDIDNKKKSTAFMALGSLAIEYDSWKEPLSKTIEVGSDPLSNLIHPIIKNDTPPLSNLIDNNNTIQNTESNLSSGSASEPRKRDPKVRKKNTRLDTETFYQKEIDGITEYVLEKEWAAAADKRQITVDQLEVTYKDLIDYMTKPSDKWPSGMWRCILTKPYQLSFDQYCKLILKLGMNRVQIRAYLDTWENKSYDNDSIYATFCDWWGREKPTNTNQQANGQHKPTGGLQNPIRQPQ